MKKICQYCGEKLGYFDRDCPNCGAVYEECSHCEETESYNDSRYYRDPSEYGSYDSRPMHDQPQHRQAGYPNRQFSQPRYQQPQYQQPQFRSYSTYDEGTSKKAKKSVVWKFALIIAVISIIMIVFVIVSTIRELTYKSTLEDYFDSFEDADGKAFVEAQYTDDMLWDFFGYSIDEVDELHDQVTEWLIDAQSMIELNYGDDLDVSFKVIGEHELNEDELFEMNSLADYMNLYLNIDEGYELELEIKVKGDEDSEVFDAEAQVINVDGAWLIYSLECDYSIFNVTSVIDAYFDAELSIMNSFAEDVFDAAEMYAQFCKDAGKLIGAGAIIGGEYINEGESIAPSKTGDELKLPSADYATYEDIVEGINTCVPDGMVGMVYCVEFDDYGMPCAVICADDSTDSFVGAYPRGATNAKATLSDARAD